LTATAFIRAVAIAALAALLLAVVVTWLDWRLNPGGVFHDAGVTNWKAVGETVASWFLPAFPVIAALALPITYWFSRRG
jgi:NADH:ubiquinone oxidoreductase subunit 6 (subunit J)